MKTIKIYSDEFVNGTYSSKMYNDDYVTVVYAMRKDTPEYDNATYLDYWFKDKGYKASIKNLGRIYSYIEFEDDKQYLEFVLRYL